MTDAERAERVGHIVNSVPHYPRKTISGRAYDQATQVHMISNTEFVVLDIFPPRDFDVAAALKSLKPAPVVESKVGKKSETEKAE